MRSGIDLPVELAEQIEEILADLHRKIETASILLADVSGQLVMTQGVTEGIDPVTVAALGAGDLAAMEELARQIGEASSHGSLLHEGENRNIYLFSVAGSFVLIVIFYTATPIGMVRLFVRRAAECLYPLAEEFEDTMSQPTSGPGADFGASLAQEMDNVFSEL